MEALYSAMVMSEQGKEGREVEEDELVDERLVGQPHEGSGGEVWR